MEIGIGETLRPFLSDSPGYRFPKLVAHCARNAGKSIGTLHHPGKPLRVDIAQTLLEKFRMSERYNVINDRGDFDTLPLEVDDLLEVLLLPRRIQQDQFVPGFDDKRRSARGQGTEPGFSKKKHQRGKRQAEKAAQRPEEVA